MTRQAKNLSTNLYRSAEGFLPRSTPTGENTVLRFWENNPAFVSRLILGQGVAVDEAGGMYLAFWCFDNEQDVSQVNHLKAMMLRSAHSFFPNFTSDVRLD